MSNPYSAEPPSPESCCRRRASTMGRSLKDYQPGSLYITIAVPQSEERYQHNPYPPADYLPYLPDDFDPASYETGCADGHGREEFDWGLYWHRGHGDGTWYGLRRVSSPIGINAPGMPESMGASPGYGREVRPSLPSYTLTRHEMRQSPRLNAQVVGLVRVLHVPGSIAKDLTSYLDWLAAHAAASATRSFIWAISLYLRTRRHVVANPHDNKVDENAIAASFDIMGFLWEALDFAYGEVWYGLAGQLPRPIMESAFGVEMLLATSNDSQGEDEDEGEASD